MVGLTPSRQGEQPSRDIAWTELERMLVWYRMTYQTLSALAVAE